MRRTPKILTGIVGVLLVLILALVLFVAYFDWNRVKPYIDDKVSAAIGRPFVIQGDLTAAWQREPAEQGLRSWVPWPTFTARNIQIGNPAWTHQPQFAQLDALQFRISPLALLIHHIDVPAAQLVGPQIDLERDNHGQINWEFAFEQNAAPSAWTLNLGSVGVD